MSDYHDGINDAAKALLLMERQWLAEAERDPTAGQVYSFVADALKGARSAVERLEPGMLGDISADEARLSDAVRQARPQ